MNRFLQIGIVLSFWLLSATSAHAQYDLDELYEQQLSLNRKGMTVLGGWAVGNMVWGGVMTTQTEGVHRYFHQGNLAWNGVNLLLAGIGYVTARRPPNDASFGGLIQSHEDNKRSLLLNAGLDLAYVTGGFWMLDVADRQGNPDAFTGWGTSLVLQGMFLFTFDIAFFLVQNRWGKRHLHPILDRIELTGNGVRIQLD